MDVTKFMLAAIALGLWANAALTLVRPAEAQFGAKIELRQIGRVAPCWLPK